MQAHHSPTWLLTKQLRTCCCCRVPVTVMKPASVAKGTAGAAGPVQAGAPAVAPGAVKAPALPEVPESIYTTCETAESPDTQGVYKKGKCLFAGA